MTEITPEHPFTEAIRAQIRSALQPEIDRLAEALLSLKDTLREQAELADARFAELRQTFTPSIADVAHKITEYTAAVAATKGIPR